jgi:PilZ domain
LRDRDDQRRQPRLPSTCRVEIRDRFATWSCETVDIGPRGCLVISPRSLTVGALLKLSVASGRLETRLEVAGQVVWTEKRLPFRAGISFTGATSATNPTKWFDALVAAEIDEALRAGERPASLGGVSVYLGPPPVAGPLDPGEASVVRTVGEGVALAELLSRDPEPVRSLLARGRLTLARASAVAPARWTDALSRRLEKPRALEAGPAGREGLPPPEFELVVVEPEELSPNLARLLEVAVDALLEGNVDAAERLLRRAHAVAPGDATTKLLLRRIAAHQGPRERRAVVGMATDGDVEAG